ncbi:MAG: DUF2442 domain-containing protein [Deltaproteobacteria bacterium CG06_land_8_20_14_3_00_44_19]|nr:MAG: DUF2442 domain-containing protein [Deltaproteobacteria bacterium CG06_land_8_20_14_3_00_44_19]PIV02354.1 MAG: DUF2442 domain-containing protein [Syntrophobacterales bacterium CG03_land_8_20_14_0_80_58_14]
MPNQSINRSGTPSSQIATLRCPAGYLFDGRIISVPLAWSWRLTEATPKQRAYWRIIGDGHGVHWPDIDEDISAEGMLYGIPAPRPMISSRLRPKSEQTKTKANQGYAT